MSNSGRTTLICAVGSKTDTNRVSSVGEKRVLAIAPTASISPNSVRKPPVFLRIQLSLKLRQIPA